MPPLADIPESNQITVKLPVSDITKEDALKRLYLSGGGKVWTEKAFADAAKKFGKAEKVGMAEKLKHQQADIDRTFPKIINKQGSNYDASTEYDKDSTNILDVFNFEKIRNRTVCGPLFGKAILPICKTSFTHASDRDPRAGEFALCPPNICKQSLACKG